MPCSDRNYRAANRALQAVLISFVATGVAVGAVFAVGPTLMTAAWARHPSARETGRSFSDIMHYVWTKRRPRSDAIAVSLTFLAIVTVLFYTYAVPQVYLRMRAAKQQSAIAPEVLSNGTTAVNVLGNLWRNFTTLRTENRAVTDVPKVEMVTRQTTKSWSEEGPLEVCMGSNTTLGEVEDLFCMPRPKYEPNMKNPCWWENITSQTDSPQHNIQLDLPSRRMRCLPYFHILCCSKSGTTDLYRRISLHPDIVPNSGIFGKEQLFWAWYKNGFLGKWNKGTPKPFTDYLDTFNVVANYVSSDSLPDETKSHLVSLDGSPLDMWDLRGWSLLPQNRGLREPAVLTPHLMRHLYRDPKFIVLMRDPVERLYTAYLFHQMGDSPEKFHDSVLQAISIFDDCLSRAPSRRECYFNGSVIEHLPADVHFNCYAVFIKEWLAVFPWNAFLFMRTEDYSKNITSSLLEVFRFLDLPQPDDDTMKEMVALPVAHHTKKKDTAGPMLPETRAILRNYVEPCNAELAELLKDQKYLWKDV